MIKEALQYIVGLGEANVREYTLPDGKKAMYSDKPLNRLETKLWKADALELHTLTGLVDYIKSETDEFAEKMIAEVHSPTMVRVYSQLDERREREILINAEAMVPDFCFGSFCEKEGFCIALQSNFIQNGDRDLLLKFTGTVEAGTVAQYGDDGVTQKATIKTGVASKGDAIVPNPVTLKPYRTFFEVEQPESSFIFRMKEGRESVACALFEADGGAWKVEAMQRIASYLKEKLPVGQFTVIA